MKFSLFHKQKQQADPEKPAEPQEEPTEQAPIATEAAPEETKQEEVAAPLPEPAPEPAAPQETVAPPVPMQEQKQEATKVSKTYLKAMPLKELTDIENVKQEVKNGNIIIFELRLLQTKALKT